MKKVKVLEQLLGWIGISYGHSVNDQTEDEEKIREAVERAIDEYGPALKKLGSE